MLARTATKLFATPRPGDTGPRAISTRRVQRIPMDRKPLSLLALALIASLAPVLHARADVVATDSSVLIADAGRGHAHAYAFATTPEMLANSDWSRFMLM